MDDRTIGYINELNQRIESLEELLGEAYVVVGALSIHSECFDSKSVQKALDNLSQMRKVHDDVLPFMPTVGPTYEIAKLAIEYRQGAIITEGRIRSDEFWSTADEGDIDDIDLEESLARIKLFRAIDSLLK